MFHPSALQFLKDLRKNNNKEWFEANRSRYENLREELETFTAEMIRRISRFDKSVAHLSVRECVFRINRDVRFSKDKSPYKTHVAMYISKNGKKSISPGYYFHLEPGATRISGGLWMPGTEELKKVRQEIDYNWPEFRKIISAAKFRSAFGDFRRGKEELLSRPPKGYEETNPAIAYLKLKSWVVTTEVADRDLLLPTIAQQAATVYKSMHPLINFFHRALDD